MKAVSDLREKMCSSQEMLKRRPRENDPKRRNFGDLLSKNKNKETFRRVLFALKWNDEKGKINLWVLTFLSNA